MLSIQSRWSYAPEPPELFLSSGSDVVFPNVSSVSASHQDHACLIRRLLVQERTAHKGVTVVMYRTPILGCEPVSGFNFNMYSGPKV